VLVPVRASPVLSVVQNKESEPGRGVRVRAPSARLDAGLAQSRAISRTSPRNLAQSRAISGHQRTSPRNLAQSRATCCWLSAAVEKVCDFLVGMVVFRLMSLVITPPSVSILRAESPTSGREYGTAQRILRARREDDGGRVQ